MSNEAELRGKMIAFYMGAFWPLCVYKATESRLKLLGFQQKFISNLYRTVENSFGGSYWIGKLGLG